MTTIRIDAIIERLEDQNILRIDYAYGNVYEFSQEHNAFLFEFKIFSKAEFHNTIAYDYAYKVLVDDEILAKKYCTKNWKIYQFGEVK